MSEVLATFRGAVSCRRLADPAGFELRGRTPQAPEDETAVFLTAPAPVDLPATLDDARIEALGGGRWGVSAGARQWVLEGCTAHLHRHVGAAFYRALPPRRVPRRKRAFWSLVLALARSRAGLTLLRALRR